MAQGGEGEAERLLRRALHDLRGAFPRGHPDEGDILNRLVYLAVARRAPDATELYRQAVDFEAARPAAGPFFVTDGYEYLGEASRRLGDQELAEAMFRRAIRLYERLLPVGHPYRRLAEAGLSATSPK